MKKESTNSIRGRTPGFWDEWYYRRLLRKELDGVKLGKLIMNGGTAQVYHLLNTKKVRAVVKIVDTALVKQPYREKLCERCQFEIEIMPKLYQRSGSAGEQRGKSRNIMQLLNPTVCRNCEDDKCYACPLKGGRQKPRWLCRKDWSDDCRVYFLIMPEMIPLRKYIETEKLSILDVLRVGIHICDALQACYDAEKDVFHRDVKPDNIFLYKENDGSVRYILGDFGISRPLGDGIMTGFFTYVYAAQEVRNGTARKNSDIYSLGVTLYELAGGEFDEKQESIHELGPGNSHLFWDSFRAPEELRRILTRALAPSESRYQQPSDMKADLEALLLERQRMYHGGTGARHRATRYAVPHRQAEHSASGEQIGSRGETRAAEPKEPAREAPIHRVQEQWTQPKEQAPDADACLRRAREQLMTGDFSGASEWARRGSGLGSLACNVMLAYCRLHEIRKGSLDRMYESSARALLEEAVVKGDPVAMYLSATLAFEDQDHARFLYLLEQAAAKGFPIAQYTYGRGLYEGAAPFRQEVAAGWQYLYSAAAAGHADAVFYCRKVLESHPNMEHWREILPLHPKAQQGDQEGRRRNLLLLMFRSLGLSD